VAERKSIHKLGRDGDSDRRPDNTLQIQSTLGRVSPL
jgi:hypothetical protein